MQADAVELLHVSQLVERLRDDLAASQAEIERLRSALVDRSRLRRHVALADG